MEPESLGIKPLIDSWLNRIPNNIQNYKSIKKTLASLYETFYEGILDFLRKK
jgi:dynein heavy chain